MASGRRFIGKSKPSQHNTEHIHVTSYYVSNLPFGIKKFKITKEFEIFGKVVDIYIGGKKDKTGSIFAFVRFEGVRDAKTLKKEMSRVRCHYILKVNIARYQKQSKPNIGFEAMRRPPPPPSPPPPPLHTYNIPNPMCFVVTDHTQKQWQLKVA
ncbi:unnamed protein product [Lactuca virosa]|uniref:RRM domain-containing protein n=1 Tax=Lactuca virosa TaxID=75947 RepID=A0AAU9PCW7_9ASTR|nr:unnamed protein product [Lactuca virosa]